MRSNLRRIETHAAASLFSAQVAPGHADQQVIAMITTQLSTFLTPDESFEVGQTTRHHFEQFGLRSTVASRQTIGSDLLNSTVQIYPADSVKRDSANWEGIVTETVYAPTQSRVEFWFDAPVHLLVMYDYGARREGETSISGLAPSRLRNFAHKLTFAPAGHTYREWHETSVPMRITYCTSTRSGSNSGRGGCSLRAKGIRRGSRPLGDRGETEERD
jgi:hypothetical protein